MVNNIHGWEMARLVIILAGLLWGLWLVIGTNRVERLYHWIVRLASRLQPLARGFFGF